MSRWGRGLATLVVVVSGMVAVSPGGNFGATANAAVTAAAVAPISVNPTTQAACNSYFVEGGYFDAWTTAQVTFDGYPLAQFYIGPDGRYVTEPSIPCGTPDGSHTLAVSGTVRGAITTASTTLTVGGPGVPEPRFTGPGDASLVPPGTCGGSGPVYTPGGTVEHVLVHGNGGSLTFSIQGRAGTIGTAQPDSVGTWAGSLTLPGDVAPGPATILVTIPNLPFPGLPPTSTFTVANITVSPAGTPQAVFGHDTNWHPDGSITGDTTGLGPISVGAGSFTINAQAGSYVAGRSFLTFAPPTGPYTTTPFANANPAQTPNITQSFANDLQRIDTTVCPTGTPPPPTFSCSAHVTGSDLSGTVNVLTGAPGALIWQYGFGNPTVPQGSPSTPNAALTHDFGNVASAPGLYTVAVKTDAVDGGGIPLAAALCTATVSAPPPPPPPVTHHYYNVIGTGGIGLLERSGPGTNFPSIGSLPEGAQIDIACQTTGTPVHGSAIWDKLTSGAYVSDYYTTTPVYNGFSPGIPQCDSGTLPPPPPPPPVHDCEAFVADLSIPDGTHIAPGAAFTKVWRLRNCGTTNWGDLTAVRVAGSFGPASFAVPVTSPGATADISAPMGAPTTPGHYRATYRLQGPRGFADNSFWVDINVVRGAPAPPPPGPGPGPAPTRYVALGDSYSSGEGNFPFLAGSDIAGVNKCHRSNAAYAFSVRGWGRRAELHACSGAVVLDFYAPNQEGNLEPPQLSYLLGADVGLVTATVGGNDLGFPDVLAECAKPTDCSKNFQLADRINSGLLNLRTQLINVYKNIHKYAPRAQIIIANYPRLFPQNPTSTCTSIPIYGYSPYGIVLLRSVGFTVAEQRWLNQVGVRLNNTISQAVQAVRGAGVDVSLADAYSQFADHGTCTGQPWINGFMFGSIVHPADQMSFHPNPNGQSAYTRAINAVLHP